MDAIGKTTQTRNQAIDQGRLIAAFMVIFIHTPIPGVVGKVIITLSRVAVPFFFMVSGYYAYGRTQPDLCKRAIKTGKLFFWSVLLYLSWDLLLGVLRGSLPEMLTKWISVQTLYEAFILQTGAIKHLWFLLTLAYCYLVYAFVFRNTSVKAKVFISIPLLLGFFVVTQISRQNGVEDVCRYSRNLLFDGLPFFLLGSVVSQKREQLFSVSTPLMWVCVIAGFLLAEAERVLIGETDLYFGTMLGCFGLFVLLASDKVPSSQVLSKLGRSYSGDIYIMHMLVLAWINIGTAVFCAVLSIPSVLQNQVFLTVRCFLLFAIFLIVAFIKEKVVALLQKKVRK